MADLLSVNRKTAAYFCHRLGEIVTRRRHENSPVDGRVEIDESYFGGARKGKRGRGAAGKAPVFGILERGGKVYYGPPRDQLQTLRRWIRMASN